jgi:hypothetical protein
MTQTLWQKYKQENPNRVTAGVTLDLQAKRVTPAVTNKEDKFTCGCGCGRSIVYKRRGAKYYDDTCRKRASRADANAQRELQRMIDTINRWEKEGRNNLLVFLSEALEAAR